MRFFLLIFCLPLAATVNQNNDFQVWVTEALHKKIDPSWNLRFYNEWRIGDNASKLYFFYLQGNVVYKINHWAEVSPGYRQIWTIRGDQWRLDDEPLVDVFFMKKKGRFEFQFRNRLSYVIREKETNLWQYRSRVRWVGAWNVRKRVCRPYVSNEVFFNSFDGFGQDRIVAGMIVPLADWLHPDFYYMLRYQVNHSHWTHQHILGAWFNFHF